MVGEAIPYVITRAAAASAFAMEQSIQCSIDASIWEHRHAARTVHVVHLLSSDGEAYFICRYVCRNSAVTVKRIPHI